MCAIQRAGLSRKHALACVCAARGLLAALMEKGVPVTVTYQPVLLNNDENGNLVTAFADHQALPLPWPSSRPVKIWPAAGPAKPAARWMKKRLLTVAGAREGKPVCVTCEQSARRNKPAAPVSP